MSEQDSTPSLLTDNQGDLFEQSLSLGRVENALFMNRVRFLLAVTFALVYLFAIFALDETALTKTSPHLLVWGILAAVLWLWGERIPALLNLSRFGVALLDIPLATWIQHTNIQHSGHRETTAIFTLALFVFLVAMSSFSLRPHHLVLTAAVAIAGLLTVYSAAGVTVISYVAGTALLIVTAAMMSWFPKRQGDLIRQTAERQAMRNRLARYFSPGVAEVIEGRDDPGQGESCEISVLFCDIRGFTRLSESLDAAEVVELLNEFHGHMVDEIFRFGGTLDKYLGDGLLAYFNAPVRQPDHAVRAVNCALAMIDGLEALNGERREKGLDPVEIGIGLHAGEAVVGNIGAVHRREFTAIGDTVNVASRLESLTKNYETAILASGAIASRITDPASSGIELRPSDSVEVRGRQQEIQLFMPGRTRAGLS